MTSFVQDDAHIFCTPDQLADEVVGFCRLLFDVYKDLGFEDVIVRLSTRPDQRLGTDAEWDHAEHALRHSADLSNLNYTEFPGEGAFYGPKLEFVLKDSLGRLWQCGTLQVDFMLPQRLGALYVDADGQKQHCIMIHRAILGSFERFIGVFLEHTGGHLPVWLAPVQVMVASVSEKFIDYAETVAEALRPLRVETDRRNENLRYKLRDGLERKIPYIIVVGGRDAANGTVCVRHNNAEETLSLADAVHRLRTAAACPA
jgi:threonyl-tRNA synthetase